MISEIAELRKKVARMESSAQECKKLGAEIRASRNYAEKIVETVREPLVVLNSDLVILTVNRSFYDTFEVTPEAAIGKFIYDLGNRTFPNCGH